MSLFAFQDIVTSVTGIILLVAMSMAIRVASAPATQPDRNGIGIEEIKEQIKAAEAEADRLEAKAKRSQGIVTNASSSLPGATAEMLASLEAEVEHERGEVESLREKFASEQSVRDKLQNALDAAASDPSVDEMLEEAEAVREEMIKLKTSNRLLFNLPPRSRGPVYLLELFPGETRVAEAGVKEKPIVSRGESRLTEIKLVVKSKPQHARWVLFAHPGATDDLAMLRQFFDDQGMTIGFDLLPNRLTVIDLEDGAP